MLLVVPIMSVMKHVHHLAKPNRKYRHVPETGILFPVPGHNSGKYLQFVHSTKGQRKGLYGPLYGSFLPLS